MTTYRGYTIEIKIKKVAWATMFVYRIYSNGLITGRTFICEDDGGFTYDCAVDAAKRAINRM